FGRPVGDPMQEVGGVGVTLAALCTAVDVDLDSALRAELDRVMGKIEAIRAKQAAKPKHSPLPEAKTFNIVGVDNYGRDYNGGKSEVLIASNIRSETEANLLADVWNNRMCGPDGSTFAVVRDAAAPLYEFTGY